MTVTATASDLARDLGPALADDLRPVRELARVLEGDGGGASGGAEALARWLYGRLAPSPPIWEQLPDTFSPFLDPETLRGTKSLAELASPVSRPVEAARTYAEAVTTAFGAPAAAASTRPGSSSAGAAALTLDLVLACGVAAVPVRALVTGLPPQEAGAVVRGARAALAAVGERLSAIPTDVVIAGFVSLPSIAALRERAARVLRLRSADLARWGAAVAPEGRSRHVPGRGTGTVLVRAARILTDALPGAAGLGADDRARLDWAAERMLAWFHAQGPPQSPEAWLAASIPGAAVAGWEAALRTALIWAVGDADDLIQGAAGPGEEAEVEESPDVGAAAGGFPTGDQLAYLRRRYGDRVADEATRVRDYGDIDDTPNSILIGARVLAAEAVLGDVKPLPGWHIRRSNRRIGIDVHELVRDRYVTAHRGSLVVADRVVYVFGFDIGTLAPYANGQQQMPPGFRNPYTRQQLQYLNFSLRGGDRRFQRTDITDLTDKTVYEVKPRSRAPQGVLQLWSYLAGYNVGAQYIPDGVTEPRLGRAAYPYVQGFPRNPHVISEGDWRPEPSVFPIRVSKDTIAAVATYPQLPGLLLYDLYERVREAEQEEARDAVVDRFRRWLRDTKIPIPPPWIDPRLPPPPGRDEPADQPVEQEQPSLLQLVEVAAAVILVVLMVIAAKFVADLLVAFFVFLMILLGLS